MRFAFLKVFPYYIFLLVGLTCHAQSDKKELSDIIEQSGSLENPNESLKLLLGVLDQAVKAGDSEKAKFYYQLGVANGKLYRIDSANQYFKLSVDFARQTNDTLTQLGALNGLGNVARITNDNEQAKDYFEQGILLAKGQGSAPYLAWQSRLLGNVAGIFFDLNNYQSALNYSLDALKCSRQVQDSVSMATNLIQIGYCYNALRKMDSALAVNQQATEIYERIGNRTMLVYQYYNMGDIYLAEGDLNNATDNFIKCLGLAEEFSEYETQAGSLNALGKIALENENFDKAGQYLIQSMKLAEGRNLMTHLKQSYYLTYQLELSKKNLSGAIDYLVSYHVTKDSIQKTEMLKSVEDFRIKYETAEKEKQIVQANAELDSKQKFQTFLLTIIAVIVLFGTIAIVLIIQRFRLRRALLSQEIDTLRVQIQSIFPKSEKALVIDEKILNKGLFQPLSPREIEILQYAITVKTNREIAELVFLSINTVKYHLKNIYDKLGVSNRSEALEKLISKQ